MDSEKKKHIAAEVIILLIVLALITYITRLWPILLLVILGILICALRLLFIKARSVEAIAPALPPPEPPKPETEISIVQKAFGLLQRRITEQVWQRYPSARWVFGASNALDRFGNNEPLIILLNGAGGYRQAWVIVHNLMFKGLNYGDLETEIAPTETPEDPPDSDPTEDPDDSEGPGYDDLADDVPINYGRLAFEWVDANMVDINAKYNEAIAKSKTEMLIPADELPHPDSWPDLCEELRRNGFDLAEFAEDGIKVNITL